MRDGTIITQFNDHEQKLKDSRDYSIMVNFTVNTLIGLLISKGLIKKEELDAAFMAKEEDDTNV